MEKQEKHKIKEKREEERLNTMIVGGREDALSENK